eukprot:scaffold1289_cov274-Pinguiococcus_pyrenoidosus.AAC.22
MDVLNACLVVDPAARATVQKLALLPWLEVRLRRPEKRDTRGTTFSPVVDRALWMRARMPSRPSRTTTGPVTAQSTSAQQRRRDTYVPFGAFSGIWDGLASPAALTVTSFCLLRHPGQSEEACERVVAQGAGADRDRCGTDVQRRHSYPFGCERPHIITTLRPASRRDPLAAAGTEDALGIKRKEASPG